MAVLTLTHRLRVAVAPYRNQEAAKVFFAMEAIRELSKKVAESIDFTVEGDYLNDEYIELIGRVRVVPGEHSLQAKRDQVENGEGRVPVHLGSPYGDLWESVILSAIQKYQER